MSLFGNGEPEGFLFFVQNYNMALNGSGILATNVKLQYLRNLLCREAIFHFDTFCVQVVSMTMAHFNQVILGLGM